MKPSKFKTLVDSSIVTIRANVNKHSVFTAEGLMAWMQIDRSVASQIITQLKKDQFLHTKDARIGDLSDASNRGKRLFRVKESKS